MTTQSRLWGQCANLYFEQQNIPIAAISPAWRSYKVIVAERNRSIFGASLAILVPTPVLADR
jgi:hypothetical protein